MLLGQVVGRIGTPDTGAAGGEIHQRGFDAQAVKADLDGRALVGGCDCSFGLPTVEITSQGRIQLGEQVSLIDEPKAHMHVLGAGQPTIADLGRGEHFPAIDRVSDEDLDQGADG